MTKRMNFNWIKTALLAATAMVSSVSYTHLDVYKRQEFMEHGRQGRLDYGCPGLDVRTLLLHLVRTQLDVYKRQFELSIGQVANEPFVWLHICLVSAVVYLNLSTYQDYSY